MMEVEFVFQKYKICSMTGKGEIKYSILTLEIVGKDGLKK